MRTAAATFLFALCGCSPAPVASTAAIPYHAPLPYAALKPVKVAELERMIAEQKGKVVVLDIWFLGCAPCVKKFPYFVELHGLYAAEGLVCMSVDVEMDENERKENVLTFLREKGASFTNLIIDDTVANRDAWQAKNDANATPSYVAYNRKGERVPVPFPITPDDMKVFVKKLLDEK